MSDELPRRLRELDPAPGPERLVDLDEPDRRPWHRRLPAAAATTVVIVAIGGLITTLVSLGPEPVEPVPPAAVTPESDSEPPAEDQAIEAAEAYIGARNAYDAERARELVSDRFRTSEVPDAFTLETMEFAFEVHEAYGFRYVGGTCEVVEPKPEFAEMERPIKVSCVYGWTTEMQRITGYPPVPVTFVFYVEDGLIQRILHDWNSFEFLPNVYDPWLAFLGTHHPRGRGDALATHGLEPERTRRFNDRAAEYLADYETWIDGAGGAFEPDADRPS